MRSNRDIDKAGVPTACINQSRVSLAFALRRLRRQSPELARAGRDYACWVGWPSKKEPTP